MKTTIKILITHDMDDEEMEEFIEKLKRFLIRVTPITTETKLRIIDK